MVAPGECVRPSKEFWEGDLFFWQSPPITIAMNGPGGDEAQAGLDATKRHSPRHGHEGGSESGPASPPSPVAPDAFGKNEPGESPGKKAGGRTGSEDTPDNPWRAAGHSPRIDRQELLRRLVQNGRGRPRRRWKPPVGTSWTPWGLAALALVWLGGTSLHPIGAREQGIVATFGADGRTLAPGLGVTWPWPIETVRVEDVGAVRHMAMPEGEGEQVMLTRDAALVDVGYDVRWRVRDLRRFVGQVDDPAQTLRLAADTAMRSTLAGLDFAQAMGSAHGDLTQEAARRLQGLLDSYGTGIVVDGIDLRHAQPPARVADAWRDVTTARQQADTEIAQARSWASQMAAHAQGEADAFDKVYAEYRLAPEVTRRRMYYETMERVLGQSDKVILGSQGAAGPVVLPPLPLAPPQPPQQRPGASGEGR